MNFRNTLDLAKSNNCVSSLCTTQTCISVYKKIAKIYDLILTPFSPFDIKCKNLIRKTSGNVFFGRLGE